jgi:predicted deacylase
VYDTATASATPALRTATPRPSPGPFSTRYQVEVEGRRKPLLLDRERVAEKADQNGDGILDSAELASVAEQAYAPMRRDLEDYTSNLAHALTGTALPYMARYPSALEIEANLREWEQAFPDLLRLVRLGSSAEGRPIWAAVVCDKAVMPRRRAALVGQLHGREWMGHQTLLAFLRALLEEPDRHRDLLRGLELWVVPLANPDGYEYSRNVNLSWRKNRRVQGSRGAVGADLNRNFPADFRRPGDSARSRQDDWGGSDFPQDQGVRGHSPASEPETVALSSLLDKPGMLGLVDLHGFGCVTVIPDTRQAKLKPIYATVTAATLKSLGPEYRLLHIGELYPITGSLEHYADRRGVIAMSLEVGEAFQPRPEKIKALNEQVTRGLLAFLRALLAARGEEKEPG